MKIKRHPRLDEDESKPEYLSAVRGKERYHVASGAPDVKDRLAKLRVKQKEETNDTRRDD